MANKLRQPHGTAQIAGDHSPPHGWTRPHPHRLCAWQGLARAVRAVLADARPDDEDGGKSAAGGA